MHEKYELGLPEVLNRKFFLNALLGEGESEQNMLKLAHLAT